MPNASVGVGTYAGEAARPYVAAAILSADTIANGYCSVIENVHSKAVLRKFSGAAIQDASCGFAVPSTGELTLGEAVLTAKELKVNEQVCNPDLRATWEGMQMRGASSAAPADFSSYVAQYVAAKVAENVEHNIWAGEHKQILDEAAPYSSFKGIIRNIQEGSPDRETVSTSVLAAADGGRKGIHSGRSRYHHGRRRRCTRYNRRRPEHEDFHEPCICSVVLPSSCSYLPPPILKRWIGCSLRWL